MPALPTPVVDDATRRQFLGALGAAGLLASACGTGPATGSAAPTRRVTDLAGRTVDIPADPQRIVALDPNRVIADLVALGLVPVGATTNATNPEGGFAATLGPAADGMAPVGVTGEADLEQVAALAPDLIFHATDYQDISTDTLAAIAPVIVYPRASTGLFAPLRWLGELVGRAERAAELERDLLAAFAERRDAVGLTGRRVAVVNLGNYESGATVTVSGGGTNAGEFAGQLGATVVPDAVDGQSLSGTFAEVSLELVPTVLADAEFVIGLRYGGSTDNENRFSERTASPVWRSVPAVAAGQVAYLDIQETGGNIGLDGVRAALDDLTLQLA